MPPARNTLPDVMDHRRTLESRVAFHRIKRSLGEFRPMSTMTGHQSMKVNSRRTAVLRLANYKRAEIYCYRF
jgi:hypothetical protein